MKPFLFILLTFKAFYLIAQGSDAQSHDQLESYSFNIIDGKLIGNGSAFLKEEMSKSQFTLLGEYHGSARISEFTSALIPILDSLKYKTIVLEVGRFAGEKLDYLSPNTQEELKSILDKYKFYDAYKNVYFPIPFFENIEDALFLKNCKKYKWKTLGVDQEYYDGLVMLFDMIFNNLSDDDQHKLKPIHQEVIDSLNQYYIQDYEEDISIMSQIKSSPLISKYFSALGTTEVNSNIITSIMETARIYESDWYSSYALRVKHMKSNLKKQLDKNNFDTQKDKLLAKMGAYHLSKGFSLWGTYELGNTLNEMASYHGNSALNIIFLSRYYTEKGQVKDLMDSDDPKNKRYNELRKFGKVDEWVVIDLRSELKKYISSSPKYSFNKYVEEYMKTYDLVVIPKMEIDATPITR